MKNSCPEPTPDSACLPRTLNFETVSAVFATVFLGEMLTCSLGIVHFHQSAGFLKAEAWYFSNTPHIWVISCAVPKIEAMNTVYCVFLAAEGVA